MVARSGASRTRQRFPALGTGHAAIDGVVGRRGEINRLAIADVDGEAAARGTEAADHPRRRVGCFAGGDLPQPNPPGARRVRESIGRRGHGRS